MLSHHRHTKATLVAAFLTLVAGCGGHLEPTADAGGAGGQQGTDGGAGDSSGGGGTGQTGSGGRSGADGTGASGGGAGTGGAVPDASGGAGGTAPDSGGGGAAGQPTDGGPTSDASTCRPAGTMMVTDFGGTAWQIDGVRNPPLTLCRGATYRFALNAPGHPFVIQTADGLTDNDGVTGNGLTSGELVFVVPKSAPDTLRYICAIHPAMTGPIYIVN